MALIGTKHSLITVTSNILKPDDYIIHSILYISYTTEHQEATESTEELCPKLLSGTLKSLINVQHVYLFHMFCFRTECCLNQNN